MADMTLCRIVVLGSFLVSGLSARAQTLGGSPVIPSGDRWFNHPEILCAALQKLGYQARAWGQIPRSPVYICSYTPEVRSSDSPAVIDAILKAAQTPNALDLDFEVSGLSSRQADSSRIAVTIPTPEATVAGRKLLVQGIESLYGVIGQKIPAALPFHIQNQEAYLSHQTYGAVSFRITGKPPQQILWFYLHRSS